MIARSIRASIALALLASRGRCPNGCPVSLDAARRALAAGDAARLAEIYETLTRQGESLEAEIGLRARQPAGR